MGNHSRQLILARGALTAFVFASYFAGANLTLSVAPAHAATFDPTSPPASTTSSSSGPAVNSTFDPTAPPASNQAKIASMGTLFQSCSGGLQNSVMEGVNKLADMAKGTVANPSATNAAASSSMGFGVNATCQGSDQGPSAESISCANLAPNGLVNAAALESKRVAIELALANIQCKKGRFEAVKGELGCLTTQAEALAQQLSTMDQQYQANTQRIQQDFGKIKAVEADRDAQKKDMLSKLQGSGGEGGTGAVGLLQIQKELKAATAPDGPVTSGDASIPGQVLAIQDQMKLAADSHQAYEEAITQETMIETSKCFNSTTRSAFTCVPNGPPVSAREYVLCRYKQNGLTSKNGVIEQNQIVSDEAQGQTSGLTNLLDQIMGEMPQRTATAGGAPQNDSAISGATLLNASQIEDQYGSDLAKYNGKGLDIHSFVVKEMGRCYQVGARKLNAARKLKGSQISVQAEKMATLDKELKIKGNTMIQNYTSKYTQALAALTGNHMPITTSGCLDAAPAFQVSCLNDIHKNMDGLLRGDIPNSSMTMVFKGTDPQHKTDVSFPCKGVDGCITALTQQVSNVDKEKMRLSTFKTDFVQKAVASQTMFTKSMASMMSAQGAALRTRLKNLNSALVTMNVTPGIDIKPVQGEAPAVDENGLPKAPTSVLQLIGGQMNPPMLDVAGENFSGSLAGVSAAMQDLGGKISPLTEAKNKLATIKTSCNGDTLVKALTRASQTADEMVANNCGADEQFRSTNFCGPQAQGQLEKLVKDVSDLPGGGLGSEQVANLQASLNTGANLCTTHKNARDVYADQKATEAAEAAKHPAAAGQTIINNAPAPTAPGANCAGVTLRISRDLAAIGTARNSLSDNPSDAGAARQ